MTTRASSGARFVKPSFANPLARLTQATRDTCRIVGCSAELVEIHETRCGRERSRDVGHAGEIGRLADDIPRAAMLEQVFELRIGRLWIEWNEDRTETRSGEKYQHAEVAVGRDERDGVALAIAALRQRPREQFGCRRQRVEGPDTLFELQRRTLARDGASRFEQRWQRIVVIGIEREHLGR